MPLERWLAERDTLAARQPRSASRSRPAPTRRRISPTSPTGRWSLSRFAKFADGRAFSYARLLRDRHGFKGELRATGDVLIDEIPLMLRCGFDAFEATDPPTLAALEAGRLPGPLIHYQPASGSAGETAAGSRPWLRATAR